MVGETAAPAEPPRPLWSASQASASASRDRQLELLPLAPRARVELALATGEGKPVERDGRGDARAAVGDELSLGELRERLVPGSVERAGNAPRDAVDWVRLAAKPLLQTGVHDHEPVEPPGELVSLDRVVLARTRLEARGLDLLLAGAQRAEPPVELEHGAVVVAEVAEKPPEPLGAAHVPVGDDEDALADPRARRGADEVVGIRERVPPAGARRRGEILVDVEKRRARVVSGQVELAAPAGVAQLPAAIDELVAHRHSVPEARRPGNSLLLAQAERAAKTRRPA